MDITCGSFAENHPVPGDIQLWGSGFFEIADFWSKPAYRGADIQMLAQNMHFQKNPYPHNRMSPGNERFSAKLSQVMTMICTLSE